MLLKGHFVCEQKNKKLCLHMQVWFLSGLSKIRQDFRPSDAMGMLGCHISPSPSSLGGY